MRSCARCRTPYKTRVEFCGLDGAPVIESEIDPLIGATFDRYRVVTRLGGGGMAAVYRAVHQVIDREVAVKVLFGELASDQAFAERFRREAQAASRIKHPHVVEIHDFGTTAEGMSFLIMELLRGQTLGEAIDLTGPFVPRRAAAVLRQIAQGLGAAHALGFVHRDLKPGNVMLVEVEEPGERRREIAKILDFGLVQARSAEAPEDRLTGTGEALGTPFYMAPEQFQGEDATPVSDLYSLGVVLHEMLSGSSPFRGSIGEVVVQHASAPPPPLPPSEGLEELARELLEKSPRNRPQSVEEVLDLLDALALGAVRPEDIPVRQPTLELELQDVVVVTPAEPSLIDADTVLKSSTEVVPPGPPPPESARTVRLERREPKRQPRRSRPLLLGALLASGALGAGLWLEVVPPPDLEKLASLEQLEQLVRLDELLAQALPLPAGEPRPVAPATKTAAALTAEVEQAFARRGLEVDDGADVGALAPLLARWQEAVAGDALEEAEALTGELVLEIARARIDQRVLLKKLGRLEQRVAANARSAEERAALTKRLAALREAVTPELSEAECSRLALRAGQLEREASP